MSAMSDEENAALVIKTGIEQAFVPLHRLLDQLLGPAATEVGLAAGDSVKFWRIRRALRFVQEIQRLTNHSNKEIHRIATRLFFPVLEAASIEDDDEMQTRWAALIANEATSVGSVHPSYIDVLKQLAPVDAKLLDELCDWSERYNKRRITTGYSIPLMDGDSEVMVILKSREDSLDNLVRLGLIRSEYEIERRARSGRIPESLDNWYELSHFAMRFVRACRAPTKAEHC